MKWYRAASTSGCCIPLTAAAAMTATEATSQVQAEMTGALFEMRWAVIFIVMLVITDFWTGLTASVKIRKENFRLSRAIRRTAAKFFEYVSFIILGAFLFKSICEPYGMISAMSKGGAVGAAIALYAEADSIYSHVCALHGFESKISIKRLIVELIRTKNKDVGSAIDRASEESNTDKNE